MERSGFLVFLAGIILVSTSFCSQEDRVTITGNMDYVGSAELYIEKPPLHYKYSPDNRYPVSPTSGGQFSITMSVDSTRVLFFTINDQQYPLVAIPGQTVQLSIRRAHFPDSVSVEGYPHHWNEMYQQFLTADRKLLQSIENQLPAFRQGKQTDVLELYKNRINIAKRHLGDTPLEIYYHKAIGEYLVKRLEAIKYRRGQPGFDPQKERERVLEKAKKYNFFTYPVLKHQRAGIRDFTNAYANTFGVEERLEEQYGQDLMQYDIKRLGYETMDSARTSVLDHIEGERALSYSRLYLIAERIGEMSPEVAEPSYRDFIAKYEDQFSRYTSFLKDFYAEVKRVSPGQPAVDFSLPNPEGEIVQMDDFEGKYVLLDFWAAWCVPCLDEFPHMRDLYNKYSRENFEIVAISIEKDSLTWRRALQQFQNPWVQLYGGNGFQQETFDAYRGGGIPFYILVNRKGNIERYNDIRPSFNLESVLDSLITRDTTGTTNE